jgi:hypothetical protein
LKNEILSEVEENKLKTGVEAAVKLEGEADYNDEKQRAE